MHRVGVVVVLVMVVLSWGTSAASVEISASLGFSTVRMAYINEQIQLYADDHHDESIGGIHSALSSDFGVVLPFSILGVEPCVYGRGLYTGLGESHTQSTALGLSVGGRYLVATWGVQANLGVYRGTFSFLRAGYDGLRGWGIGIDGAIEYSIPLTARLSAAVSITARWLTVDALSDRSGTSHAGREAPFLDFSGVGAVVTLRWIAW